MALVLNLPTSSAQEIELKQKELIIELNSDKLAVYGKEITLELLEQEIAAIEDKEKNIIFNYNYYINYSYDFYKKLTFFYID